MRRMYSEKQLIEVALKGLEDKDVKVKTIQQSEYEYVKDFSLSPDSEYIEAQSAFTKILVKNKSMYICIVDKLINNDSASHSTTFTNVDIDDLPSKYQEVIFDVNGKKVSETPTGETGNLIARFPVYIASSLVIASLVHNAQGKMQIALSGTSPSISASTKVIVDGRIELCL